MKLRLSACVWAIILSGDGLAHPDLLAQVELLDQQLQRTPADASLLLKRGDLHRRHQDYAAAARDFAAARASEPGHELLDFFEGRLLHLTGSQPAALERVRRFLDAHPDHASAWKLGGDIHRALQQPAAAAEAYLEAIRFSQAPSPDLYRNLVLARLASGEGNWPAALQGVDSGLERFGIEVSLVGLGTDISLAQGRPRQAAAYLDRLPARLLELPAWASRSGLRQCLEESGSAEHAPCLEAARVRLSDAVTAFMTP